MKKLAQDLFKARSKSSNDQPAQASPNLSRRRLFTRQTKRALPHLPWAIEERFTLACTRCESCISACPEQVIVQGEGGFPEVNFDLGECTFCYACANACQSSSNAASETIFLQQSQSPWQAIATFKPSCLALQGVECRSCQESCEPFAIEFGLNIGSVATPKLNSEACTGCGACVSVCPTQAIAIEEIDLTDAKEIQHLATPSSLST
ncbi:MAG: ferredoxin-type protein NapF [Vibrio sp.]